MESQIVSVLKQVVHLLQQIIQKAENDAPRLVRKNSADVSLITPVKLLSNETRPYGEMHFLDEDISRWWDDSDLMIKLKLSKSTILRRRKDGTFKSFPIGRRHYYKPKDIIDISHQFMK